MNSHFPAADQLSLFLAGFGSKSLSLSMIYGAAALISAVFLLIYWFANKKKEIWYILLFVSVFIVNAGYLMLAVSPNLDMALTANRISYFGSVFLPLSMLMIILKVTRIRYGKWLPCVLVGLAVLVFFIAASPGYLNIYYKEVTFQKIDGVTVLKKVYGPLHISYLFYLLLYFSAMVITIVYATLTDKIQSTAYAVMLAISVFVNIGVWLIEQLVKIDFEILSISYIISECFLLGLRLLMLENQRQQEQLRKAAPVQPGHEPVIPQVDPEQLAVFCQGMQDLTPKEQAIYSCYIQGMTTAQVLEQLRITENTLKYHNKNIYSKLGVSSRKQLVALHAYTDNTLSQ